MIDFNQISQALQIFIGVIYYHVYNIVFNLII
jgi:hypothetical protein